MNVQVFGAPVPEPTTMIAGALLLLPFGVSTLRVLRKSRKASPSGYNTPAAPSWHCNPPARGTRARLGMKFVRGKAKAAVGCSITFGVNGGSSGSQRLRR